MCIIMIAKTTLGSDRSEDLKQADNVFVFRS